MPGKTRSVANAERDISADSDEKEDRSRVTGRFSWPATTLSRRGRDQLRLGSRPTRLLLRSISPTFGELVARGPRVGRDQETVSHQYRLPRVVRSRNGPTPYRRQRFSAVFDHVPRQCHCPRPTCAALLGYSPGRVSSSMFTSLNVSTRTLATNRAGPGR